MPALLLKRSVAWLVRAFKGGRRPKTTRPADPRIDGHPWLSALFDALGERYRLGDAKPDGLQILHRSARERFNPKRLYLRPETSVLALDYDARIRDGRPLEAARSVLDNRITAPLGQWGLRPGAESVEDWGGKVLTRRYEGPCPDAANAAAAIRFFCEHEQVIDVALE
jgi:hypothetical protein